MELGRWGSGCPVLEQPLLGGVRCLRPVTPPARAAGAPGVAPGLAGCVWFSRVLPGWDFTFVSFTPFRDSGTWWCQPRLMEVKVEAWSS